MRRRSRHTRKQSEPPERPTTTVDEAVDVITQSDAPLDDALRALARLLARQAAREIFERESRGACDVQPSSEDLP